MEEICSNLLRVGSITRGFLLEQWRLLSGKSRLGHPPDDGPPLDASLSPSQAAWQVRRYRAVAGQQRVAVTITVGGILT